MRLHRFYLSDTSLEEGKRVNVAAPDKLHQWKNVFRLGTGDEIIIFNGTEDAEYRAKFVSLDKKQAELEIGERRRVPGPKREVTLYLALIKKDHFEWALEKATELGVRKICPILTDHTELEGFNGERTEKILIEATEQAGWCRVPAVMAAQRLEDALDNEKNAVVCDIGESTNAIALAGLQDIGVFIGPEGGWSAAEQELFLKKNTSTISFGPQTLRAETAAMVAVAFTLL